MILHKNKVGVPQVQEGRERSESLHDVSVVASGFRDGRAQLCVAKCAQHGKESTQSPNNETEADWPRFH